MDMKDDDNHYKDFEDNKNLVTIKMKDDKWNSPKEGELTIGEVSVKGLILIYRYIILFVSHYL